MHIISPWTPEQVAQLNKWQAAGYVHPFTCSNDDCAGGNGKNLVATGDGWRCPSCDYKQDWCHDFMMDETELNLRNPKHHFSGK